MIYLGFRRDAHARSKNCLNKITHPRPVLARCGAGLFATVLFTAGRFLFLGRYLLLLLLNKRLLLICQTLPVPRSFDQSGSCFRN